MAPSEKYQASSTNAVPTFKPKVNFARAPQIDFQKYVTAPITTPSFPPPQPAPVVQAKPAAPPAGNMKFTSRQLALLLSQNKNPYLPLDKETEKQLSFTQSPAWSNLLAPIQQQQQPQQQQPNPVQYSPQVQNIPGFSPQAQPINFGQPQQPTHSPVYNNQIVPTAQLQPFEASQNIQSIPNTPSSGLQGGTSQYGAVSGYQSNYNTPQNILPQSFPVSHSPAVPQTVSLPSSLQLSNNHVSSQPSTSPQIQYSYPAGYGSSPSQISYVPQNLASLPSSQSQSPPALQSTPVQYSMPQYQPSSQHNGVVQFNQQNSHLQQSPSTIPVKNEQFNLPQNFAYSQNQIVPNIPKDYNYVSSQPVNAPQVSGNYYSYPSTTSSGYAPQSANVIVPYSQSGTSSGVHTASPYSSSPEIAYKPETPQFTGQNNAYGSGLGSYASHEAPAYASVPSQGNVYGQNSVQGYTSGAASNQVIQSTPTSGYNDGSKSYAIIPAPAQYAVPNQSSAGGYPGAGDVAQKSYRAFEYSPAPTPVTENANVRYVYVPSDNAPSNVK